MKYTKPIHINESEIAHQELLRAVELAGGQTALAKLCGEPVRQQHVFNWINRDRKMPVQYTFVIEDALKGAVKHYRLRPDVFKKRFFESLGIYDSLDK